MLVMPKHPRVPWWPILSSLAALLSGALLALMPLQATVILMSMALLVGAWLLPWPILMWAYLALVAFVIGPVQYLGGFAKAFWWPHLMGVLMGLRVLTSIGPSASAHTKGAVPPAQAQHWMRIGLACLMAFAAVVVASSLAHRISPLQWLVGGKEYLFLWSLPAAFGLGLLQLKHLRGLWRVMAIWLAVQALVVLWQRFLVAPRRGGDAPWDAVVGLFAGKANGAGGSGTMAMVSLWAGAAVAMAARAGLLPWPWAWMATASALLACTVAEVKVAVVLLPLLGLFVLGSPAIQKGHAARLPSASPPPARPRSTLHPATRLLAALALVGLSGLLMWAHQQQFSASGSVESHSASRYAQTALERNLDTQAVADEHGQLSRLGAFQFWWARQSISDLPGLLVGHGVGAVRHSTLAPGELIRGLRVDPGRSSALILLWETGVVGLCTWVAASWAFMVLALRLLPQASSAHEAVCLRAALAIIVLAVISLPYGADWFEAPHLAVAHLLGIAMVWAAYRERRLPLTPVAPAGAAP